ncbi:MAG: hypothetical protein OEM05_08945 [Myxococcales bacterium]|nr:hypothetical protein [Myxococcales bacterium]
MSVGLPEALERAASGLPAHAGGIRPANGDPAQLLERLGAEAAARVLEWLLCNEPEAGAELAAAWAEDPETGAGPLRQVAGDALPKESKKALRRALHRLRSRGVAVPQDRPSAVVARLPSLGDDLNAAMVSAIDPRGARLVYLVESNPSGGARLFEVMLDETRGVLEVEVYTTGRSRARQFLREITRRGQFPAVEADPQAVRALVARAASGQAKDRPLPRGFAEWRSRVSAAPEGTATPGELAREALGGDEENGAALERAADLVRRREIGPWPPGSEVLGSLAEELAELGRSRILVSPASRRERAESLLQEGAVRIFDDAFAAATSRRFEESAYVLWKREAVAEARACLAAARAFRAQAPGDNPVARAILDVVLEPALRKLEEESKSEEESSLLVRP